MDDIAESNSADGRNELIEACRHMLDSMEELIRDCGGHYDQDAAERDAEILWKALVAAGTNPPPVVLAPIS